MADYKIYVLLNNAEKEEHEINDLEMPEIDHQNMSAAIFNILATVMKGEPLQILHNSNFSGCEAWRRLTKRYSPTTPMRGMQLLLATLSPGKVKKMDEPSSAIDKWETKLIALQRDFNEKLSDKMRSAILVSMAPKEFQDALVQQADNMTEYKATKDRIITMVDAKLAFKDPDMMDCDQVGKGEACQGQHVEEYEYDVDAMGKGRKHCFRCGGLGRIAASCATPAPEKGSGKGEHGKDFKGGKTSHAKSRGKGYSKGTQGQNGKAQPEWQGFCSYCGKRGHGPRDCWQKQKDEANANKMDVSNVNEEYIGGFDIGSIDKDNFGHPPNLKISNRFEALQDIETTKEIFGVDEQPARGKITVDSGAAESVWPEDLLPEVMTRPSVGSRAGVNYVAANGQKMPNLGEKKIQFKTKDDLNSSTTFQVTQVKKPLAAVSKITEKGNWVCFGPGEAYIHNIATDKRTHLDLINGTYSLDVEYASVFSGQGR